MGVVFRSNHVERRSIVNAVTKYDLELYEDTNLIAWPSFPLRAVKRHKEYGLMFAVFLPILIYVSIASLSGMVGFLAVISVLVVAPFVFALMLDKLTTADVVVFRNDSSGLPCQDWQRWWIEDAVKWPDAYKHDFQGKRVLFIDGLEGKPIDFDAWLADPPKRSSDGKEPITGSRVAGERSTAKAIDRIAKFRPQTRGEQIQQGLMVGAIAVCMVAILMAADRVATVMGQGV